MSSYHTPRSSLSSPPGTNSTNEVHIAMPSEGMPTDRTTQVGGNVMATPDVNFRHRRLFEATQKGDLRAVRIILDADPRAMTATILTVSGEKFTALDIAIRAAQDELVENLVERIPQEDGKPILLKALRAAVEGGRMRMVRAMVNRDSSLEEELSPLMCTVIADSAPMEKELLWYIAPLIPFTPSINVMTKLILAGHSDIGLFLARKYLYPTMSMEIIKELATRRSLFCSGAKLGFWGRFIYKCIPLCLVDKSFDNSGHTKMARALKPFKILLRAASCIKKIGESKLIHNHSLELANLAITNMKTEMTTRQMLEFLLTSRTVLTAAEFRIIELVKACFKHYPELQWEVAFTKELIETFVKARDVDSFRQLNTPKIIRPLRDQHQNLMGSVVELSQESLLADVPGGALLLQRELQWLEAVEGIVSPLPSTQTYRRDFVKKRKDMVDKARKWVGTTSVSCCTMATLIVTIVFAAVFAIPGGSNDSDASTREDMKKTIFGIATAALITSLSAFMIFWSIAKSHHAVEDFLESLPGRMICGLSLLLFSLIITLVGFSSAIARVLGNPYIPIILVPLSIVLLFVVPLYVELIKSTYWPQLKRPLNIWN